LREPLTYEEFLSHVLHALTNTGGLDQPDFCCLGRWLRHNQFGRQAEKAGGPRQRQSTQEPPPADPSYVWRTHENLLSRCWSVRPRAHRVVHFSSIARTGAAPNARHEPHPKAVARDERRL